MPEVRLSSPDKALFGDGGPTKADLAAHFERAAPAMLPHLRDRPLSVQVFPGGIGRQGYFMKQVPQYFPRWVRRATVPKRGGEVTHVVATQPATLRLLAQHNALTIHVPTSRLDRRERPDRLIVDLDPPDDRRWADVVAGARIVADLMRGAGLEPFAMATGSRGLHVVAPQRRELEYPAVFALSKDLAARVVQAWPEGLTTEFHKVERDERVFVDVLRNRWAQTVVAPYSPRARPGAPVAVPLRWDEVETAGPRPFTIATVGERLRREGDPWGSIASAAASPRAAARRLAR